MIRPEPVTIDGRTGVIVFVDKDWQPVEPSDPTAVVARAVFDDGGSAHYAVQPDPYSLGGEGSGNFGHAGRPGEVGGSAPDGSEGAAKEAEYRKLVANRAQEKALADATAALAADTAPGGRWEHFDQRQETQHKLQQRLKRLLPGGGTAIISGPTPNLLRTGELTARVLEDMKAQGLTMPDHIKIESVAGGTGERGLGGAIRGITVKDVGSGTEKQEKHLEIRIPETLPEHTVLDDAVKAVFSEKSTVSPKHAYSDTLYPTYDRYTARTMEDIIVHEMGHVQAGHRGRSPGQGAFPLHDLLQSGAVTSVGGMRRAAMRVSEYALSNQDEFLAEGFTRRWRGETLADDSQKLYDALNGPMLGWDREFGKKTP